MSYAVAVDIGGTFTDLVAYDHAAQKVIYAKSPTTYENLVEGILDCFKKARVKAAEATLVNHGDPSHQLADSAQGREDSLDHQ
jgi:N-methylhydantoinase A